MSRFALLASLFAALSSTGCRRGPDCASSLGGAVERMLADAKTKMPPDAHHNVVRSAPKLTAALVDVCTRDAWSAEVLSCLGQANQQRAINACYEKLAPPQRENLRKRSAEALEAAAIPASPPER